MAERSKKISELVAANSVSASDLLVLVNQPGTANATTKKITSNTFIASAAGISHANGVMTIKSANTEIVNLISNTYVQIQYSPSTSTFAEDNTGNTVWTYVQSGVAASEVYNNGALVGGLYVQGNRTAVVAGSKNYAFVSSAPGSAGATGTQGDIAYDSSYVYICVANNTWKRAALTTW